MPCILVRNSMNMEQSSNRVAELAFEETRTYIDCGCGEGIKALNAIAFELQPLTQVTSNALMSTWYTGHPPFVVLEKLKDLGLSVVAANTVGVTTVWTLQGNLIVERLRRPIRNDQRFNYAGTMPNDYQGIY